MRKTSHTYYREAVYEWYERCGCIVLLERKLPSRARVATLERLVAVFDSESERAERVIGAINNRCASLGLVLCYVKSLSELSGMLSRGACVVLFCDVRAETEGHDVVQSLHTLLSPTSSTQIVYTGVQEDSLISTERGDYAYLMTTSPKPHELVYALDFALERHERLLERPFVVRVRQYTHTVWPKRISFVESVLRKVRIHMGGETLEVYAKLSDVREELPAYFVQCHKSFVVNMNFIQELGQEHVLLTSGDCVPVSQKRRKVVREAFLAYVGRTLNGQKQEN